MCRRESVLGGLFKVYLRGGVQGVSVGVSVGV